MIALLLSAILTQSSGGVCLQSEGVNKGCVPYLNVKGAGVATSVNGKIGTIWIDGGTSSSSVAGSAELIVRGSSGVTVSSGVGKKILFLHKVSDTANAYDPTTGNYTAPASGSYYVSESITVSCPIGANTDTLAMIMVNGIEFVRGSRNEASNNPNLTGLGLKTLSVTALVNVLAGDTISGLAYLNLSAGTGCIVQGSDTETWLTIFRTR